MRIDMVYNLKHQLNLNSFNNVSCDILFTFLFIDGNWSDTTDSLEINKFIRQRASSGGGGVCVFVRDVLCMVMGTPRLVDTKWNIPTRNEDIGFRICSQFQYALHLRHSSSILVHDVSHASLHIFLLCCLDCGHGVVCSIFIARDQECSHWCHGWEGLEATSCLEEVDRWWWWEWG